MDKIIKKTKNENPRVIAITAEAFEALEKMKKSKDQPMYQVMDNFIVKYIVLEKYKQDLEKYVHHKIKASLILDSEKMKGLLNHPETRRKFFVRYGVLNE